MAKVLPLFVLTFIFLFVFAYAFADLELASVRANWNERRCEPLVMLMAQKVPTDPSVDTSAFASENFSFCMGKIIDSVLATAFKPVMGIFNKQVNIAEQAQGMANTMRTSATSLMKPITEMFQKFFDKIKYTTFQIFRIFFKIQSAIDRISAVAAASVFAGMSMYQGILNAVDFVVKVVFIILGILVALVIFLFFIMAPFIPTILATIGVLVAAGIGAAEDMKGSFCVAPDTLVKMVDGGWKSVIDIQAGDELWGGSVVEGVLEVMAKDECCVDIDGLIISKSHLLSYKGVWIFAGDHPNAIKAEKQPKRLFCLNTSDRCWTVKTMKEDIVLRDWEELPEDDEVYNWEALIFELLNRQAIVSTAAWAAPGRGLFGGETKVHCCGRGIIPIRDVKVGDWVMDQYFAYGISEEKQKGIPFTTGQGLQGIPFTTGQGLQGIPFTTGQGLQGIPFTQVLGVYRDTSELVPVEGPNAAVWCWLPEKNLWRHPKVDLGQISKKEGYQLVTDSGTFKTLDGLWARDFTEVGHDRIHETYSFTSCKLSS